MTNKMNTIPPMPEHLPSRGNAFSRWCGRTLLRLFGWKIEGELPNTPQCLAIGAPHTSNWDFFTAMFLMLATGIKISWMGKHQIFVFPIKGLLEFLGGVPTIRNSDLGMVDQQINLFKHRPQFVLGISPEGTRKKVQEWKTGFHRIAHGAQVPVFPFYWNYETKTIHLAPLFYTTDEMEKDIAELRTFFKKHGVARNPKLAD